MSYRRPSLVVPPHLRDDENYIYLIFSGNGDYPINLSYTNNLTGVETNKHRVVQLALDIAQDEYRNTGSINHNVIVRCEPGNIDIPLWSQKNKRFTLGGCVANEEGVKFIEAKNIVFKKPLTKKKESSCIIS